ncbi:enterobactin transporter EntS [Methylocystis sp. B8]|uniref:enterobactin transporter EntS n=1 Tax=Methylocystis sp. B8 TaxID=544938 RepID=UPI0010FE9C1B|nr:enterobactin transporter EntS [Methylocystis sp. B8]TLG75097.1 enterobactin transporter EntS [Methylocystis sp. B8]
MDSQHSPVALQETRNEAKGASQSPAREPAGAGKSKSSLLLDFSLLRDNAPFRTVVIARTLSVFALGMLTVAAPVQIQDMTGSPMQVGIAIALGGGGAFAGLLAGGVLADRWDRRKLILFARSVCGLGFAALAVNGFSASPSVLAMYVLALWDGFFSALGVTALLAATPFLVGRENLAAAGAFNMLTVRMGGILSPAIGGIVIASFGVGWNYVAATIGTLITVTQLMRLPPMPPAKREPQHPLRALGDGIGYLFVNRLVGAVVAVGALVSLGAGVRILLPALGEDVYRVGPSAVGFMYSAAPLGATLAALTSGWLGCFTRSGALLLASGAAAFAALGALGVASDFLVAFGALAGFGYLSSIASLLQFTLVQRHTPDQLLGRVNGLWAAQAISGEAFGALALAALSRFFAPTPAILTFSVLAFLLSGAMAIGFRSLRCVSFKQNEDLPATLEENPEPRPATLG